MRDSIATARLATAIAAALTLVSTDLLAQQSSNQLEEIVVTARKRDESFHNVPITVNVLTEQAIKNAGIDSTRDFVAMIPNMTLVEVQNVGNSFITVRGIQQARNSEPSVAVLVDGVLETNPYQFDQELVDVRQIEVLKGPQGALYGRNAIGGAILIHTKDPSDKTEGSVRVGIGNGTSERAQLALSGPLGSSNALAYRASFSYYNTDGYLDNVYLHQKADPYKDYSGRMRLMWKPNDSLTADLRAYVDRVKTTAYYYIIPRSNEANPFTTFTTPPNANDVASPIQNNNLGMDDRDIDDISLKLDFAAGGGTLTAVTDFNKTKEIDTGDSYDFRPINTSIFRALLGVDLNQSQFIDVKTWSQELRFTSPKVNGFSWIAGGYFVHTTRFISTGNMVDTGTGAFPVYETPRLTGSNPSATFLADSQDNNAWALFGDATYELSPQWELDAALRYDSDKRENTTKTPETPVNFLATLQAIDPGDPQLHYGAVREHTWSQAQPKGTLRFKPTDDVTLYGGWSRGFRSGGFNQAGTAEAAVAAGIRGVQTLFEGEVADTWEVGIKSQMLDRRLNLGLSLFKTKSTNTYFFVFLPNTSTQNLGNLDAKYKGAELEINAKASDRVDVYFNYGYTGSEITGMADPSVIGKQAPLVSKMTINAGIQYREPMGDSLNGLFRIDYQNIGRTWWDPYNVTSRNPVNLVNLRMGVEGGNWSLFAWSKNLINEKYNAEFSPGGFLWRAPPRRYGVDFQYKF